MASIKAKTRYLDGPKDIVTRHSKIEQIIYEECFKEGTLISYHGPDSFNGQ